MSGITIFPKRGEDEGALRVSDVVLSSYVDFDKFTDALFIAARALWADDMDAADTAREATAAPAPAAVKTARKKRKSYAYKQPKPGSIDAQVIAAIEELQTDDLVTIADHLDKANGIIGMSLGRLRKGGFMPEIRT